MATGGPPPSETRKSDDFRRCCSLCMEPYRGRCPKLLHCFHTFCQPCLTALADNAARSGTGEGDGERVVTEDDHHGDTFLCPTCRAPVIIPEGGVSALQTNVYIDYEGDSEGPLLCQMCIEGEEKEATHYCQQCEQHMCQTCKHCHSRVPSLKGHHVVEVVAKPVFQPLQSLKDKKKCLHHHDQTMCDRCCQMEAKMAVLEAALDDLKAIKVAALDTKITTLETSVKGLTDKSLVPKVSFHARESTGKTYADTGKIIFNDVDSNNGNGYNPSDGVFTAPEAGTYMFMATVRCSTNGTATQAHLSVKGVPLAYMIAPDSATVHATVSLNKGDLVCVVSQSSFASGANYTFFSGAMISF